MLDIREVNARPLAARRTTTTTTAPHSRHTAAMNESDDPMPDECLRVVCLCADWCGVCRDYRATFDSASATFGTRAEFSWIDIEDEYHFDLGSDDGSRLYSDDKLVIDNEGVHAPERVKGSEVLTRGVHKIRVTYFHGPRFSVALVLGVARGKEQFKLFRTRDFQPPKDGQELMPGEIRKIKKGTRPIGAL